MQESVSRRRGSKARGTDPARSLAGRIQLWGHPIAVDWAEPEVEVDEDTMSSVKILYVRNLMLSTTEETIEKEFNNIKPGRSPRVPCLRNRCCKWKYFCLPKTPKETKIAVCPL